MACPSLWCFDKSSGLGLSLGPALLLCCWSKTQELWLPVLTLPDMVVSEAKQLLCHHKWGQNYSLPSCSGKALIRNVLWAPASIGCCQSPCWCLLGWLRTKSSAQQAWTLISSSTNGEKYQLLGLPCIVWHKSWAAVFLPSASKHGGWWGAVPGLSSVG